MQMSNTQLTTMIVWMVVLQILTFLALLLLLKYTCIQLILDINVGKSGVSKTCNILACWGLCLSYGYSIQALATSLVQTEQEAYRTQTIQPTCQLQLELELPFVKFISLIINDYCMSLSFGMIC